MPWHLYLAIKQIFPSGRKCTIHSLFYLLSVLGITMGVALLVISQSVMGGFGETWREKIIQTNGHIRITSPEVIHDSPKILDYLNKQPEVKAAAPFASGVGMLRHENQPAFPHIFGLDLENGAEVIPIKDFLILGSLNELDDDAVFLSSALAASIGASYGATVEVYTPLLLEKLKQDEVLLPRELLVSGIYETGWHEFDENSMLITLRLMQELYDLRDGGVHAVSVRLKEGVNEDEVSHRFNQELEEPLVSLTWAQMFDDFLWVLGFERFLVFILTIPINMVGAFVIVCAQLLSVTSKTREIGLLAALGGTPGKLLIGYCFQGFMLGLTGTVFGIIAATTFLHFRDDIVFKLAQWTNSQETLIEFYQFAYLPVHYSVSDFAVIIISALSLSTLASVIPAFIAARKNPADALRAE